MVIKTKRAPMSQQSRIILIDEPFRLCPVCRNDFTKKSCCDNCNHSLNLAAEVLVFPVVIRRIKEGKK